MICYHHSLFSALKICFLLVILVLDSNEINYIIVNDGYIFSEWNVVPCLDKYANYLHKFVSLHTIRTPQLFTTQQPVWLKGNFTHLIEIINYFEKVGVYLSGLSLGVPRLRHSEHKSHSALLSLGKQSSADIFREVFEVSPFAKLNNLVPFA